MATKEEHAQDTSVRLLVGSASHRGITRKDNPNEDSVLVIQGVCARQEEQRPFSLFVVADGMGGHTRGQEASRMAIRATSDSVLPAILHDISEEENLKKLLADAMHHANLAIYQQNRKLKEDAFMGTTVTAALVVGTRAFIANVGDSRTYLYRRGEGLFQVTRDHPSWRVL